MIAEGGGVAAGAPYDVGLLREREFPWAARGDHIYLNNASTGPLPQRTVGALDAFTARRAEPWRISDAMQFGTVARTRELAARLIGASTSEIAVATNTSHGLNLAARSLPLAEGDVVLTFDREFPANIYPWMAVEQARGIRLHRIPCTENGLPDEDALLRALDEVPQVRVVSVSWVQFASGYRIDIARLGRACHERGIWFVVDAIQGLGALTLDVGQCPVDILACGAQKWLLSPWGTGFVYVREALVRLLQPHTVSWLAVRASDDFRTLVDYDLTWHDDARRFETMTLPFQDFAGMNASLELLLELGPAAAAAHVTALASAVVDWAEGRSDVRLVTPAGVAQRAGIISVVPKDPARASAALREAGISHSLREGAVRLSPHCYNTIADVERALAVLD